VRGCRLEKRDSIPGRAGIFLFTAFNQLWVPLNFLGDTVAGA
jgi:hypothetical protein